MTDNPNLHHRRSIRQPGFDYTNAGLYFVTLVTHGRENLFGKIVDGEIHPNPFGEIVREEWFQTAQIRPNVELDPEEFVVMPNHVHGISRILDDAIVGATRRAAQRPRKGVAPTRVAPTAGKTTLVANSLGAIIGQFKSISAKRINARRSTPGLSAWQRNYYEHIIRSNREFLAITDYIRTNPQQWEQDQENPTPSILKRLAS